jgi:mannosyltransferase
MSQYEPVRQFTKQSFLNPRLLVALEMILAAVLGLAFLGEKSFWVDEGFSYAFAKLNWTDLWQLMTEREANQGLYFVILRPWLSLGENEAVIRSLSVIFAVATIPLTYALGSRLFGTHVGLIAAFLMVGNGFFVHYAQEARAYSLLLLLVTGSSLLFVVCLEKPSRMRWVTYGCVSALAAYAHFFGILVLVAHAASLFFIGRSNAPWKSFLATASFASLLVIPLGLFVLFRDEGQLDWVAKPTVRESAAQLVRLSGGDLPAAAYFIACSASAVAAVRTWSGSKASPETWRYAFLLSWLFVPLLVVVSISQFKPILATRYLIICIPPLVLLASLGIFQIRRRMVFGAGLLVLVGFSLLGVADWYVNAEKDDWRSATSYVLSESQPGDAVIFYLPRINSPFDYYRSRLDTINDDLTYIDYSTGFVVPRGSVEGSGRYAVSEALASELKGRFKRVWLILSYDILPSDPQRGETSRRLQTSLDQVFLLSKQEEFRGVRVLLYRIL